jgi:quercetin dioxygenase-like cupin family protein
MTTTTATKPPLIVRRGEGDTLAVTGAEVRLLCEAHHTANAFSFLECVQPVASGPPPHQHDWDEAYYVVEGEVRFTLGEEEVIARQGDFIYAPAGTVHGFQAVQPSRMLIFDTPAHAGEFFRDIDREVKDFPREAYKMGEIGARHGIHFIR